MLTLRGLFAQAKRALSTVLPAAKVTVIEVLPHTDCTLACYIPSNALPGITKPARSACIVMLVMPLLDALSI